MLSAALYLLAHRGTGIQFRQTFDSKQKVYELECCQAHCLAHISNGFNKNYDNSKYLPAPTGTARKSVIY